MIRRSLVAVAAVAAVVVTASPASARPVQDEPTYCGPGYTQDGARCEPRIAGPDTEADTVGEWALGVFGVIALLAVS